MTATDDVWKSLAQVIDWIKTADTKAAAILAGCGVFGGVLVRELPVPGTWPAHGWAVGFALLSLGLASISGLVALSVFAPRLGTGEPTSWLYFDHIARRCATPAALRRGYLPIVESESRLRSSLTEQLWATSRVARAKFRLVRAAVWLLGAALLVGVVAGVLSGV